MKANKSNISKVILGMHLCYTNRTDEYKEGYNKALNDFMEILREMS